MPTSAMKPMPTFQISCIKRYTFIGREYRVMTKIASMINNVSIQSFQKNRMWSFSHLYLNYELKLTKFDFDGFKYQWFDGVFSVTLGGREADGYRKAFFHPMAR